MRIVGSEYVDLSGIENELNTYYVSHPDLNLEDLQIYAYITDYSYCPINFGITNNKISLENDEFLDNRQLFVGTKRQFIQEAYLYSSGYTVGSNKLTLSKKFVTAWNSDKFMIFMNGLFIGRNRYRMVIPTRYNNYNTKTIIFDFSLPDKGQIDVIYIDNDEDMDDVPYNRDLRIYAEEVGAAKRGSTVDYGVECLQKHHKSVPSTEYNLYISDSFIGPRRLIKVPYPYDDYPRGKHTFFVFKSDTQHLIQDEDYIISNDGEYITLRYEHRLGDILEEEVIKYITFIFPYLKPSWDGPDYELEASSNKGTGSGISYFIETSISGNTSTGIVTFSPTFTAYELSASNIIVMGNTTYIDSSRYTLLSNNSIRFTDSVDIANCASTRYTMIVFQEKDIINKNSTKYQFETYSITADKDTQYIFKLPRESKELDFIIFKGSLLMDQKYRYIWDKNRSTITLTNSGDYLLKGQTLQIVYLTSKSTLNKYGIRILKMQFELPANGSFTLPSSVYDNLSFNNLNLMLYLDTTYIEPNRYTITNNKVTFIDSADSSISLLKGKLITGLILEKYKNNNSSNSSNGLLAYEYINVQDDRDFIWFDEQISSVHK